MSFALFMAYDGDPLVVCEMSSRGLVRCPCTEATMTAVRASLRVWPRAVVAVAEEAGVGLRTAQDALAWLARDGEAANEGGKWRSA